MVLKAFSLQNTFSFAHFFLVHNTKVFMKSKLKTKSLKSNISVNNFFPFLIESKG